MLAIYVVLLVSSMLPFSVAGADDLGAVDGGAGAGFVEDDADVPVVEPGADGAFDGDEMLEASEEADRLAAESAPAPDEALVSAVTSPSKVSELAAADVSSRSVWAEGEARRYCGDVDDWQGDLCRVAKQAVIEGSAPATADDVKGMFSDVAQAGLFVVLPELEAPGVLLAAGRATPMATGGFATVVAGTAGLVESVGVAVEPVIAKGVAPLLDTYAVPLAVGATATLGGTSYFTYSNWGANPNALDIDPLTINRTVIDWHLNYLATQIARTEQALTFVAGSEPTVEDPSSWIKANFRARLERDLTGYKVEQAELARARSKQLSQVGYSFSLQGPSDYSLLGPSNVPSQEGYWSSAPTGPE